MTIQVTTNPVTSSGAVSFSELRTKLKETASGSVSLSELYRNGTYVPSGTTNTAVPTTGTVSVSNYYGVNTTITATITNTEENLNPSSVSVFGSNYTTAIKKKYCCKRIHYFTKY